MAKLPGRQGPKLSEPVWERYMIAGCACIMTRGWVIRNNLPDLIRDRVTMV